jgi:hypothetical protein
MGADQYLGENYDASHGTGWEYGTYQTVFEGANQWATGWYQDPNQTGWSWGWTWNPHSGWIDGWSLQTGWEYGLHSVGWWWGTPSYWAITVTGWYYDQSWWAWSAILQPAYATHGAFWDWSHGTGWEYGWHQSGGTWQANGWYLDPNQVGWTVGWTWSSSHGWQYGNYWLSGWEWGGHTVGGSWVLGGYYDYSSWAAGTVQVYPPASSGGEGTG